MSSNANNNFYILGYEMTIKNAKRLNKLANISAEQKEFGIACSLSILAAEEAIKAFFILAQHYNKIDVIDDFEQIFKEHKTKHSYIPVTSHLFEVLINIVFINGGMLKYLYEALLQIIEEIPKVEQQKIRKGLAPFLKLLKEKSPQESKTVNAKDAMNWWSHANSLKQRGLYVNKTTNRWMNPEDITEIDYNNTTKFTSPIVMHSDRIYELIKTQPQVNKEKNTKPNIASLLLQLEMEKFGKY